VGKFILETKRIRGSVNWENGHSYDDVDFDEDKEDLPPDRINVAREEEAVEFDSQDEDECEDLFAGVWSPELAMKRRRGRRFGRAEAGGSGSGSNGRARSEDVR
jgi:hypothetical protein